MKTKIRGHKDSPVMNWEEDFLGVEKYVHALCEFVSKCETPMTVSIQGEWGCGKTSFINLMRSKLCSDKNKYNLILPEVFNTWQYSQFDLGEQLPIVLVGKLIEACGGDDEALGERVKGGVKKILNVVGSGVDSAVSKVSPIDIAPAEMLLKVLDKSDDSVKIIENLKEQFQKCIDEAIKHQKKNNPDAEGRMIVFIDDLDRLSPVKAVELLEVLKVFMDCKNCVFILAIDYEVIVRGVKQKYGDDFSRGKQFFDKIIQLPYKMPIAQYEIKTFLDNAFRRMDVGVRDNSWDDFLNDSKEIITCSVGYNPRGIKRLLNAFQLLQIVNETDLEETDAGKESIKGNKSLLCLLALLCVQYKYENIYFYLVKSLEGRAECDLDQLLENLSRADELKSGTSARDACDGYSDCVKGIRDIDDEFEEVARLFKVIYDHCKDEAGTFKLFEKNLRTSSVAYIDKSAIRGNGISGKGHRKTKVFGNPSQFKCSIQNIKKAEGLSGAKYRSIRIFGNEYQVAGSKSIVYKTMEVLIARDKERFDEVVKAVPKELEVLICGAKKTETGREIVTKMEIDEYIFESKFNAARFLELLAIFMVKMGIASEELEIHYIPAYDAEVK